MVEDVAADEGEDDDEASTNWVDDAALPMSLLELARVVVAPVLVAAVAVLVGDVTNEAD